ncbi:MAG: hypothetical protein A3H44_10660 [Gammaproteobacteria bacterium RIFCSPLOWO2_02_FULL_57_10]|nr:MAG: hypothetical protein A3H44_10660 [Gammaproteobacteria bacterium RIFCSPLOWO2_02_FULL_57_10]
MGGRYKAYPEYKDSGAGWLGEIPQHWNLVDGKRVFSNERSASMEGDEQLAASQKYGVIPQSLMMEKTESKVMLALKGTTSFRHVEKDDFVISLRSFEGGIEHSAYKGCVSPAYTVLRAEKQIYADFFRYFFKSTPYVIALQSTTDSLRDGKSISYEQFGYIPLVLPTIKEQRDIASFLSYETAKIDTLIEKQQQLIQLLKEKRQAVISHAVTKGLNPNAKMRDSGVEWLGEVPEHWEVSKLGFLTNEVTVGIVVTPAKYYVDSGIPCLRSLNVRAGYLQKENFVYISEMSNALLSKSKLAAGDVVVVRTGQPGTASLISDDLDGCNCIDLIIIRKSPKLMSKFLELQLNSEFAKIQISAGSDGAIQQHFNVEMAKSLRIFVPLLQEQQEIVSHLEYVLDRIDELQKISENAVTFLQERRTALISAAVTGKIDVRDWVPPTPDHRNEEAA